MNKDLSAHLYVKSAMSTDTGTEIPRSHSTETKIHYNLKSNFPRKIKFEFLIGTNKDSNKSSLHKRVNLEDKNSIEKKLSKNGCPISPNNQHTQT